MKNVEKLHIYKQSMELARDIYSFTARFPEAEMYDLLSQARDYSISIPSNIATGFNVNSSDNYVSCLEKAYEYATKLYCLIHIANKLQIIEGKEFENSLAKLTKIMNLIYSFRNSLLNPILN